MVIILLYKKTLLAIDVESSGPLNDYLVHVETEIDGDTFYIMSTNVLHEVTKEMVDRYFPTWDEAQWGEEAQPEFGGQKFQSIGKRRKTLTKKRKRNFI